LGPQNVTSAKPSFDCSKAHTPLSTILCTDENAAHADWDVDAAAWAFAFSLQDDARKNFWREQDSWIKSLNSRCKLTAALSRVQYQCVLNSYRARAKTIRSKLTGDALAESMLTPEQRAEIQGELASLGLLNDLPDGQFGSNTRAAIREFQQANGFAQSNYMTGQQIRTLASVGQSPALSSTTPQVMPQSGEPRGPASTRSAIITARNLDAQRKAQQQAKIELEKTQVEAKRAQAEAEIQRREQELREQVQRDKEAAAEAERSAELEQQRLGPARQAAEDARRGRQEAEQRLAEIRRQAESQQHTGEEELARKEAIERQVERDKTEAEQRAPLPLTSSVAPRAEPPKAAGQFSQQGPKLIGTGKWTVVGESVALSRDGSTAIMYGYEPQLVQKSSVMAWVFTRSHEIWNQQQLINTGLVRATTIAGASLALAADGNTAIISGRSDDNRAQASVFVRAHGVWTQEGELLGVDAVATTRGARPSVSLSADGNTAIISDPDDNNKLGAAWVFSRSNGVWGQQGPKLVGAGAVDLLGIGIQEGISVALSGDGKTAMIGGRHDNNGMGAAWVFVNRNGIWKQQGEKLVGTGAVRRNAIVGQGISVSLSADGSTALVGGDGDDPFGAAWVFTRSGEVWTQQGQKLVGNGGTEFSSQGFAVALSADGNTALVGAPNDSKNTGATWVFTRANGVWTQSGPKLVGTGAVGNALQGISVALSADANTVIEGGYNDGEPSFPKGAAWVFTRRDASEGQPRGEPPKKAAGAETPNASIDGAGARCKSKDDLATLQRLRAQSIEWFEAHEQDGTCYWFGGNVTVDKDDGQLACIRAKGQSECYWIDSKLIRVRLGAGNVFGGVACESKADVSSEQKAHRLSSDWMDAKNDFRHSRVLEWP
jgi:peptidoglycan hydrolase-like protein with peptidoglycan-binding domain